MICFLHKLESLEELFNVSVAITQLTHLQTALLSAKSITLKIVVKRTLNGPIEDLHPNDLYLLEQKSSKLLHVEKTSFCKSKCKSSLEEVLLEISALQT